ncbi:unnamed protein product [Calicophoron daubneyi]|uniref:Uncharacterized protein n=1 Tax=Calicophoron daubneyi TaxID=300641 RepID=A0AAV2SZE2_CALDB
MQFLSLPAVAFHFLDLIIMAPGAHLCKKSLTDMLEVLRNANPGRGCVSKLLIDDLERVLSELRVTVEAAEARLIVLRFKERQVQMECDKLKEQENAAENERLTKVLEQENALREQSDLLRKKKSKCAVYEKMTGAKFRTDEKSTIAFIFNPDGVVQHEIPKGRFGDSPVKQSEDFIPPLSERELDQVRSLWAKMKIDDQWSEFQNEPKEWKVLPLDQFESLKIPLDRSPLKPVNQ